MWALGAPGKWALRITSGGARMGWPPWGLRPPLEQRTNREGLRWWQPFSGETRSLLVEPRGAPDPAAGLELCLGCSSFRILLKLQTRGLLPPAQSSQEKVQSGRESLDERKWRAAEKSTGFPKPSRITCWNTGRCRWPWRFGGNEQCTNQLKIQKEVSFKGKESLSLPLSRKKSADLPLPVR